METSYDKFKTDLGFGFLGCGALFLGLFAIAFPMLWIPFVILIAGMIGAKMQKKKGVDKNN